MLVKTKKKILYIIFALIIVITLYLIYPNSASADADTLLWGGYLEEIDNEIGLGNRDPRLIVASIINVFLGFLGIIAVIIILLGGFKWMTSGGNEDKVTESRKLLLSGATGLIVMLMSWGIASFVLDTLYEATGGIS